MKHLLLPLFLSAATVAAVAAPVDNADVVSAAGLVKTSYVKSNKNVKTKKLGKSANITIDGALKRIENRVGSKRLAPAYVKKAQVAKVAPENAALYESFENNDINDVLWLPEGWTRQSAVNDTVSTWTIAPGGMPMFGIYPSDGQNTIGINYGNNQDEWLISPAVQTQEGMLISFNAYLSPMFLYSMNNVDWDTYEFIGDKVVAATLQVLAKAEGDQDWTLLHDYAEQYKDYSLMELMLADPAGLEAKTVSLGDLAGKKLQIALRYVGSDGNTMIFDEIAIAYPQLSGLTFSEPIDIQYWGFDRSVELKSLDTPVAQIPVYSPVTWTNNTYIDGATFSWKYCDPVTTDWTESDSGDELTLTYIPDYKSENTKRNNLFYPPVLNATAPMASPASATSAYTFFQAGGRPDFVFNTGETLEMSLLPFNFNAQGLSIAVEDVEKYGDATLPIFGHNANTNKYWLDYTLNGEDPEPGDDVQLDGILNFIYPSQTAPLVVNGVDVFAKGVVSDEAEFTIGIYALGFDFVFDPDVMTPIATAKCAGKDFIREPGAQGTNSFLTVPFDFETPAVIKSSDDVAAYVVYLTGFNSDKVEYFVPLQSYHPNPDYLCLGWVTKRIRMNGNTNYRFTTNPMAYYQNDLGEDMYGAFAIGLHGEHPWLVCDAESAVIPADGTPVNVQLFSYYDGSKLEIETPAGVTATATGRYDQCMLTLSHDDTEVIASGNVVVKAPGLQVSIPVNQSQGVTDAITSADSEVVAIYDLAGRKVSDTATAGIYIVKYADGTAKKVTVK